VGQVENLVPLWSMTLFASSVALFDQLTVFIRNISYLVYLFLQDKRRIVSRNGKHSVSFLVFRTHDGGNSHTEVICRLTPDLCLKDIAHKDST
jgi:hypothetical protein